MPQEILQANTLAGLVRNQINDNFTSLYDSIDNVSALSGNWDSVYTTFKDVSSTFLTSDSDSQTLSYDELNQELSITNGNTVSLSSLLDDTVTDVSGLCAGAFNWDSVYTTFKDVSSTFITSDSDSQTLSYDELNQELSITNGNTVSLSSLLDDTVTDVSGLCAGAFNWDSVYTTFKDVSSTFLTSDSDSQTLSYNELNQELSITNGNTISLSSLLDDSFTDIVGLCASSPNWESTYSTVQSNSSLNWSYDGSDIKSLTADWESTYTTVQSNSSLNWSYDGSDIKSLTADWESTYVTFTNVSSTFLTEETDSQTLTFDEFSQELSITNGNSVSLASLITTTNTEGLCAGAVNWDSVYSSVTSASASWDSVYTSVSETSANWDSVYTSVSDTSATWDSVYTTSKEASANWDSVYTTSKETSANWDSVYTTYNENSAIYSTTEFIQNNFLPLSGGTVTGDLVLLSSLEIGDNAETSLYVGFGKVGINTETPNEQLTVVGNISATGLIYGDGSNLTGITAGDTAATTLVRTNSANWDSVYTTYNENSATYATIDFTNNKFLPLSGGTITGDLVLLSSLEIGVSESPTLYVDEKIGILTETPNVELTVNGNISASEVVYASGGNSNEWNTGYTLVQNNSAAYLQGSAGYEWVTRPAPENNTWNSITYGRGVFVAVATLGTNRVMTSPDGVNWTARLAAEANGWRSVTYGNGLFVAVAESGTNRVMTSPDGVNWTARLAAEANGWRSVTYGNGLFVAVAQSGTNRVMTSPDGINWTARLAAEATSWSAITYGNGLFVAVAQSGTNRVMTSPDGISWTARSATEATSWSAITYGNGLFVAGAASLKKFMISFDGVSWSAAVSGALNTNGLTYGNGIFVAVSSGGGTDRIATSGKQLVSDLEKNTKNITQGDSILYGDYTVAGQISSTSVVYASAVDCLDGVILKAPDNSKWKIIVTNTGTLSTISA